MSDFPQDSGTGFLRRTKPSQPEFTGTATISGTKYRLAAWVNEGDDGKYFKISFRPAEDRADDRRQAARSPH